MDFVLLQLGIGPRLLSVPFVCHSPLHISYLTATKAGAVCSKEWGPAAASKVQAQTLRYTRERSAAGSPTPRPTDKRVRQRQQR
jgi:hypothetical protein